MEHKKYSRYWKQYLDKYHDKIELGQKNTTAELISALSHIYNPKTKLVKKAWEEKTLVYSSYIHSLLVMSGKELGETKRLQETIHALQTMHNDQTTIGIEDIKWLEKIGWKIPDITKLIKNGEENVIQEIKQNYDVYYAKLGDNKYIKTIVLQSDSYKKLIILKNTHIPTEIFNGYAIGQILSGAGWEEKVRYFLGVDKQLITQVGATKLAKQCKYKDWKKRCEVLIKNS